VTKIRRIPSRNLGEYVLGERPDAILWPFRYIDGSAINLTGFTGAGRIMRPDFTVENVTGLGTEGDPVLGIGRFDLPLDVLVDQPGRWRIALWFGNDANRRYCSQRFHFYVGRGLGTVPAI
jgi:hypothetical protein